MSLKGFIKIGVSVVLFGLALSLVDVRALASTLANIPWWLAVGSVLGYAAGQLLSAYKWWLIGRAAHIPAPYSIALKSYFIGTFVNCFGVGTLGGDVVRGLLLSNGQGLRVKCVGSVVADRAHGLAVLALIGIISTVLVETGKENAALGVPLLLFAAAIIIGWFVGPAIILRFFPRSSRWYGKVADLCEVLPTDLRVLLPITVISVLFHLSQIALHGFILYGLGISVPFAVLLATVPFVNILATLPFSWNGLGVRENSYVFFLAPAFMTAEQCVALGAIWLFSMTCSSLIGGFISVLTRDWQATVHASARAEAGLPSRHEASRADESAPALPHAAND